MTAAARQEVALVLFDLDGTLVDTAPELHDAANDTLRALDLPPVSLAQVRSWIGHGAERLLAHALAQATGASRARVTASSLWRVAKPMFAADYRRRCGTSSQLYPHAEEVLIALGGRGVRRALVTNKEEGFASSVLRRHGLDCLLDRIVCGDTLPTRKPDPAGVLDCLRTFGVAPQRAVFVGDSAIDVATARNAGVASWAVAHGYNGGQPIAAARPDRVLNALGRVLQMTC